MVAGSLTVSCKTNYRHCITRTAVTNQHIEHLSCLAVFEITEVDGSKVRDPQKLCHIQQLLNVHSYEIDNSPPLSAGAPSTPP